MRIEFNPQRLANNIITEHLAKDGKTLNRIIDIPSANKNIRKVLDITYKKSEFVPTEWFVSNYNLYRNNINGIAKTFNSERISPEKSRTVIKKYSGGGYGVEKVIENTNGKIKVQDKNIQP